MPAVPAPIVSPAGRDQQPERRPAFDSPSTRAPLVILYAMRSLASLRHFRSVLELMIERGHHVHLFLETSKNDGEFEKAWLARMLEHPNFFCIRARGRDRWHRRGVAMRSALEYLFFLRPAYANLPRYTLKALRRSPPRSVRWLSTLPILRSLRGRAMLHAVLSVIERALPRSARTSEIFAALRPDVVILGDVGNRASHRISIVNTSKQHGIPVGLMVASWDNLSTRPPIRCVPHLMTVWNDVQRREAVELHGMPDERVLVTGASNFDHWFEWSPRPSDVFMTRVGLDPSRPMILWVGSAINHWERPEPGYVVEWLTAVRAAEDPNVREVGVLLRPHPLRLDGWLAEDFSRFGNVAVWPAGDMTMPVGDDAKADYYDSIYHSRAVLGINTSAMIEASIIGRPVLTILASDYHDSQFGALHFPYLLEQSGGALRLAGSMQEHLAELSEILAGRNGDAEETARSFVSRFVRPQGLERPATPILVGAVEALAATPVEVERERWWVLPLRATIVLAFLPVDAIRFVTSPRRWRRVVGKWHRTVMRSRRRLATVLARSARRALRRSRAIRRLSFRLLKHLTYRFAARFPGLRRPFARR